MLVDYELYMISLAADVDFINVEGKPIGWLVSPRPV
jgi:hypothetical protein